MMTDEHGSAVQAEAEPTQADVWEYIYEREENLQSSDSLRMAVKKIFSRFGEGHGKECCMVCGRPEKDLSHWEYVLDSDRYPFYVPRCVHTLGERTGVNGRPVVYYPFMALAPEDPKDRDENVAYYIETGKYEHDYIPLESIKVSLDIVDEEPFWKDYYLAIDDGDMVILDSDDETYSDIGNHQTPPRIMLKHLVLSGRLPLFLQYQRPPPPPVSHSDYQ